MEIVKPRKLSWQNLHGVCCELWIFPYIAKTFKLSVNKLAVCRQYVRNYFEENFKKLSYQIISAFAILSAS